MTTLYKKVGRRYKPVAEHEEWDSYPAGAHLVVCSPGSTMRRFNIDPDRAGLLAAADEIERLAAMLEAAEREREIDEERIADLMADLNRVGQENEEMRTKVEAAENDAAHQKALAESALRVAEGWERKCAALRAKVEQMEKRLRLILEEPENTMSNSKAMREMVRQARLALEKSK